MDKCKLKLKGKILLMLALLVLLFGATDGRAAAQCSTLTVDGTTTIDLRGYNSTQALNTLYATGTWGGGTMRISASADGINFVTVQNYSWTTDVVANLQFRWAVLRVVLTGSTSPSISLCVL